MTTTTHLEDLRNALNTGNLNQLDAALRQIRLGNTQSKVKVTVAALAAAAAVDITAAATKAAATVVGMDLGANENLPPIGQVVSLRATAVGTAALGDRVISDAGGTPTVAAGNHPGIATLSDDGTTITFEGTVTGFVLTYYPAPHVALDTAFPVTAP